MKKIIIFAFIVTALLFTVTPSVQAKQQFFKLPIPEWFNQAIQPFQNTIKALTGKVDNHEARIAELEKKIVSLEEKINNQQIQLNNQVNLFTNPNGGGILTTPSDPVGIGPTNPTQQLDLNCGSNCQDLLHIP